MRGADLRLASRACLLSLACLASALSLARARQDPALATDPFDAALVRRSTEGLRSWTEQHRGELFGRVRTLLLQFLAALEEGDAQRVQHWREQVELAAGASPEIEPVQRFARTVLGWSPDDVRAFRDASERVNSARSACERDDVEGAWTEVEPLVAADPLLVALLNKPLCQVAKRLANRGVSANLQRLVGALDAAASTWDDQPWIAWYAEWRGQLAWTTGDLASAIGHFERSVAISTGLARDDAVAHSLAILALVRLEAGDLRGGLADATRAEELARRSGDATSIRMAVHACAASLYDLGEIEAALEALAKCDELGRARDATQLRLDLLRAAALQDSGRLESARSWIESALELADDAQILAQAPDLRGDALLAAGLVYGDLGEFERGLAMLEEARRCFDQAGEPRGAAWAQKNCGWVLLARGSAEAALEQFSQALAFAQTNHSAFLEGWCALGCAESTQRIGPTSERVEAWLDQAEACAVRMHDLYLSARIESLRGIRHAARGDERAALRCFAAAVEDSETLRTRFSLPGLLTHFLRDKVDPYRQAAFSSARLGAAEQALRFAELSRARVLFELRSRREASAAPPSDDERTRGARRALAHAESALRAAETESVRASRADEVAGAERELDAALLEAELSSPRSVRTAAARSEPPTPARVAEALNASRFDTLVEYVVGESATLALAIHAGPDAPRTELVFVPAGEHALRDLVSRLRAPIEALQRGELDLVHLGFDVAAARELHRLLIAPLEPRLGARVAIVPDGVLWELPFEALVCGGEVGRADPARPFAHLRGLRYWIDGATATYLPSAAALGRLELDARASEAAAIVDAPSGEADALRALAPETLRVFDAASFEASAPDLGRARWLHFSAHGVCDPRFPGNSHLALGAGERIAAWQIEAWPLSARLVVLSACDGGRGTLAAGEGALGLTRSFLAAGAAEVVASSWAVEERSTAQLVDSLWRAIAAGAEPVDALRSAKLRLRGMDDPRGFALAHPYFWAAWVSHRGG